MIIDDLHFLGERLKGWLRGSVAWLDLDNAIAMSFQDNVFFSAYMQKRALEIISEDFLDRDRLLAWLSGYSRELPTLNKEKKVGIVMAGNIPLVGFTDLLAVLVTGAEPIIKLSSKDKRLLPVLFPNLVYRTGGDFENQELDAIITMGGDDAASYFKERFSRINTLIRGSRFSVGLISGNETDEDLKGLTEDILLYYGMGCRSITHLLVPQEYDFTKLGGFINSFLREKELTFFKSQYLRNKALLSIDQRSFFDAGSFLFVESDSARVPISTLSYSHYAENKDVENYLEKNKRNIQKFFSTFGTAQKPTLMDYPDEIDVIRFLSNI